MILRNSKPLFIFLMMGLFVAGENVAIAQTKSTQTAEFNTSTTTPTKSSAPPKPAPSPNAINIGGVTFSGSVRTRFESWDWFETGSANNSYNFGAATLRLSLSQRKENFEWQIEGAFPLLVNLPDDANAPPPQGQLGLGASYFAANGRQDAGAFIKQGFILFKGIGGDKASSLKLGRFEFNDGTELIPTDQSLATIKRDHISQRLIGTFGFTHVGRSLDGAHYARNTKSGVLTFVAARPTEGVFQLRGWGELDVDFYYGAFTKPLRAKNSESDFRVFALHYHDGRRALKTDNRTVALRTADNENTRVTTIGGHHINVFKMGSSKVDTLVWSAGQFGDWGNLNHRAGAIAVEGGYQFGGGIADKIKPWVRAGYFRSTGDGDPTDDAHNTFFQVLPTPRIYARFPFYNLMNNEDVFAQFRLRPHAKLSLRADAHHLRLSNAKDLWYVGGGAFQRQTFGYIGRPSNGNKTLGAMLDLSVDWNLTPKTSLTFYIAGVRGSLVAERIYPDDRNARFAYIEVIRRF